MIALLWWEWTLLTYTIGWPVAFCIAPPIFHSLNNIPRDQEMSDDQRLGTLLWVFVWPGAAAALVAFGILIGGALGTFYLMRPVVRFLLRGVIRVEAFWIRPRGPKRQETPYRSPSDPSDRP